MKPARLLVCRIQLLQNMTGATIVDCIIEDDTIIFTVKKGEVGLAVGKGGEKIKRFRSMTNKQVEIYEYLSEAEKFITNALKPAIAAACLPSRRS